MAVGEGETRQAPGSKGAVTEWVENLHPTLFERPWGL